LTYSWTNSQSLSCPDCLNPVATPQVTTAYTLIATDANGCSASEGTLIVVIGDTLDPDECFTSFYIPNAFTPNGDGVNDIFFVYGRGVEELQLRIFNRWGELVFETKDQSRGWDGTYRGQLLNPDVFVYELRVTFCDGSRISSSSEFRKGSITLIR
jgi:gliding motility-associated-like protein